MKKFLKITGITLGVIVLLVGFLVAYSYMQPMKTFEAKSIDVNVPSDSASLANGEKIVRNVCAHCHMGDDGKLSGRLFSRAEDPFGEMYTANITKDQEFGIGSYQDGQLAYLFRTGINKDGRYVGNMMSHPNMSDADLSSIIAYLKSDAEILQPSQTKHNPPAYLNSAIVKTLVVLGMFEPLKYDGKPVPAVDMNDKVAFGKYLVNEIYECGVCHSKSFETYNSVEPEKSPGYLGGGSMVPDKQFIEVASSNLTPSVQFGLGKWSESNFLAAVRNGVRPDGTILKPNMPIFNQIPEEEIMAIWAYLKTVPAIDIASK